MQLAWRYVTSRRPEGESRFSSKATSRMHLSDQFDAVIMLTWSDWKTEPRSNRYHYGSRFARDLPVLFLQHRFEHRENLFVEPSGHPNLDIVHIGMDMPAAQVAEFRALLRARGIRRPLVWIYDSTNYLPVMDVLSTGYFVYHATEDYLLPTECWGAKQGFDAFAASLKGLLTRVNFMVACTRGVAQTYLTLGGYKGPYAVIENGCDAEHFLDAAPALVSGATTQAPVAIFQGGINKRLDYSLLIELAQRMHGWEFRFCGVVQPNDGWSKLLDCPNVKYLGVLDPQELAAEMWKATVGLIPYIQDQWIRNSYPLKAYEYVACGLPVVSVPVQCLEKSPELFSIAVSAAEFQSALVAAESDRFNKELLERRRISALANSYNSRFAQMTEQLLPAVLKARQARRRLRVAMLYDSVGSMHVNTITEHLNAFDLYSHHDITYLPASESFWASMDDKDGRGLDLTPFDVAIVHYSIRVSIRDHLSTQVALALEKFFGLKVLFIQDEYEGTEIARSWMDRLKFDIVYTCVPQAGRETVYPRYRFPATEFLPTLTGYVPEREGLEGFGLPLSERRTLIAYRGRMLDPIYGELGYEKYRIGVDMKRIAEMRHLPVDIEVDDQKRIYGDQWYEFLGGARATLGTESGANIFDYDGVLRKKIRELKEQCPDISFDDISAQLLAPYDGQVRMNQVSPKIFEAIRLRTVLILFEGEYSGVVEADKHFIALKKDFSNIDEVLAKLNDDSFVSTLTGRAYQDVVASGKYSYRAFVEGIDHDLEERILHTRRELGLLAATFYLDRAGQIKAALPLLSPGLWVGSHPMGKVAWAQLEAPRLSPVELLRSLITGMLRKAWRKLPPDVRAKLAPLIMGAIQKSRRLPLRVARWGWNRLPARAKAQMIKFLRR